MLEVLDTLYIGAMIHIKNFFTDEKGAVDLVAVVVLIGIALALAVIFRKRIGQVLENMFSSIDENSTKGMSNTTSFEGN